MNTDWQAFLQQQDARFVDGVVSHFGNSPNELQTTQNGTVLCDLSQFGTIKVSGADAQNFLQNMLSSDVREVNALHAQFSSLNNAKGRMLATLLIWQTESAFYLHLPRSLCATIQKRLSMYVLRSKVSVEEENDHVVCLGVSGVEANTLLQKYFGSTPRSPLAVEQHEQTSVIRIDAQRFQINTSPQHALSLWQILSPHARPVGSPCWDWLNIRSGIPIVLPETQEQFVPQMANLELIGGVSFKKGCYPGQEVVARMHYLGKLKRRMYLAHIQNQPEETIAARAGDDLFSAEAEGQPCGKVVNAVSSPDGGSDMLAVVQISSRENYTIHLGSLEGETLQFQPLPYSLPT